MTELKTPTAEELQQLLDEATDIHPGGHAALGHCEGFDCSDYHAADGHYCDGYECDWEHGLRGLGEGRKGFIAYALRVAIERLSDGKASL